MNDEHKAFIIAAILLGASVLLGSWWSDQTGCTDPEFCRAARKPCLTEHCLRAQAKLERIKPIE